MRFWCNQKEHIPSALGYYVLSFLQTRKPFCQREKIYYDVANFCPNCGKRLFFREHNGDITKVVDFYLRRRLVRGASYADLSALYPATFGVKKLRYSLGAPSIQ